MYLMNVKKLHTKSGVRSGPLLLFRKSEFFHTFEICNPTTQKLHIVYQGSTIGLPAWGIWLKKKEGVAGILITSGSGMGCDAEIVREKSGIREFTEFVVTVTSI